jgi:hypothetical protein
MKSTQLGLGYIVYMVLIHKKPMKQLPVSTQRRQVEYFNHARAALMFYLGIR